MLFQNNEKRKFDYNKKRLCLETLESRQLLSVTLPVIGNQLVEAGAPLNLALHATGTSASDHINYTYTVNNSPTANPNLSFSIPTGNPLLKFQVDDAVDNIHGALVFELYSDLAPHAVQTISTLVNQGFYNGLDFHRVLQNFVIQGGGYLPDGSYRDATIAPYNVTPYANEVSSQLKFTSSGILGLANYGQPNSNLSQFFVTSGPSRFLDGNYTIFGFLVEGEDIRQAIEKVPVHQQRYELSTPDNPIIITNASLIVDNADVVLRLTAPINSTGTATVTVTATDTVDNTFTTRTFTVYVQPDVGTGNSAPVITAPASHSLGATATVTPKTFTVGSLINNGTGTATVTDTNAGTPLGGIAVTSLTGQGTWQYSLDGTNFVTISNASLSTNSALLLSKGAKLRYTPVAGDTATQPSMTYVAWDMTFGTEGQLSTSQNNANYGLSAFSTASDTAKLTVYVNTAPVLTSVNQAPAIGPTMGHTSKDTVFNTDFSTFINNGTGTTTITDPDPGDMVGGIAITNTYGNGRWEYSLDGGTSFLQFSPIYSPATSLLLPYDAKLRYTPDGHNSESAIITYRAWDMTTGTNGDIVDLSATTSHGGTTAFSDGYDSAQLCVNDAPVLAPANPTMGTTNEKTPKTILLINSFINKGVGTTIITDPNDNAIVGGIAIVGVTGNGLWEYKPLISSGYLPLPSDLSLSSALTLSRNATSLRYTPDSTKGSEIASITYYAWDYTFSSNNKRVDISQASSRGGTTAFSDLSDTATITVISSNNSPTGISLSQVTVLENQPAGMSVGTFNSTDPDASETFTYSLVSGVGSADNASFAINGNTLQTTATFDYETKNAYNIRVRTSDQGGLLYEKAFTVLVSDQSELFIAESANWTDAGLTLKLDIDGKLHLYRTGTTTDSVPPQNPNFVTGINLVGRDGADDQLTVDLTGGNPIPSVGMVFNGGTHGKGDKLILKGSSAYDNVTLTNTQINVAGTAINYNQVELFGFDLGTGYDHLAIDRATLKIDQDNAISAGTDLTIIGGTLDLGGKTVTVGDVKLISGSILNGTLHAASYNILSGTVTASLSSIGALTKTTTGQLDAGVITGDCITVSAGTLTATSIVCDTLTIGLPSGSAAAAFPQSAVEKTVSQNVDSQTAATKVATSTSSGNDTTLAPISAGIYSTTDMDAVQQKQAQPISMENIPTGTIPLQIVSAASLVSQKLFTSSMPEARQVPRTSAMMYLVNPVVETKSPLFDAKPEKATVVESDAKQSAGAKSYVESGYLAALQSVIRDYWERHSAVSMEFDSLVENHLQKPAHEFEKAVDAVIALD